MEEMKERTATVAMLTPDEWKLTKAYIDHIIETRRRIVEYTLANIRSK